jgi:hypothetical protein
VKSWVAGAVDCDGCIALGVINRKDGAYHALPELYFYGTDRKMVEYVAGLWGSCVRLEKKAKGHRRSLWGTGRAGRGAVIITRAIRPYMKCWWKIKRADWILERFTVEKPTISCGKYEEGHRRGMELRRTFPPAHP